MPCLAGRLNAGLAPFSVMDPAALDALAHLLSLTFATTDPDEADSDTANPSSACGLRALLAVPPAEVARWMVIDAPAQHEDAAIALIGGESIGTLHCKKRVTCTSCDLVDFAW